MNARTVIAVALLVLGLLAVVFGGFSYTEESHKADIGPIELSVKEKKRVNIPVWAGAAAIAAGGVLLLVRSRPRPRT
jgi:hypothetical protein